MYSQVTIKFSNQVTKLKDRREPHEWENVAYKVHCENYYQLFVCTFASSEAKLYIKKLTNYYVDSI